MVRFRFEELLPEEQRKKLEELQQKLQQEREGPKMDGQQKVGEKVEERPQVTEKPPKEEARPEKPPEEEAKERAQEPPLQVDEWVLEHQKYLAKIEPQRQAAYELLMKIASLENQIHDAGQELQRLNTDDERKRRRRAREFIERVIWEGTYYPESPGIKIAEETIRRPKELQELINKQREEIERIMRENPDIDRLLFAPRRKQIELKEIEERIARERAEREAREVEKERENLIKNLQEFLETPKWFHMLDLQGKINQCREYLEEREIDDKLREQIKRYRWAFIVVKTREGMRVYTPRKDVPGSEEVFKTLRRLERRVYRNEEQLKRAMNEMERQASVLPERSVEVLSNPNIDEAKLQREWERMRERLATAGTEKSTEELPTTEEARKIGQVFVKITSAVKDPQKGLMYLRGGILFRFSPDRKCWEVVKVCGNLGEQLEIKEGDTYLAGLKDAPPGLKRALGIEKSKTPEQQGKSKEGRRAPKKERES